MAKAKPQLDHDKDGKAGGAAPKFLPVCGWDESGVDEFLAGAEQQDYGTERYPWPKGLRAELKVAISGMQYLPEVKETVNRIVVEKAGPGLFGRGPFHPAPGTVN